MTMLRLSQVSKSFGGKRVLDGLSFSLPENEICAFVGRNGAGKTTTMKLILGLLPRDGGEINVAGKAVHFGQAEANRLMGYLPDVPAFYHYLRAEEYLDLCGAVVGMRRNERQQRGKALLERVGLAKTRQVIKDYSRGMKQRLGIAQALLNRPKLLLCDEPTAALDPAGRREILDLLCSVKTETTILFSTHLLTDVERIADRLVFLEGGRAVIESPLKAISQRRKRDEILISFAQEEEANRFCSRFPKSQRLQCSQVKCFLDDENLSNLLKILGEEKYAIERLEKMEVSLEEWLLSGGDR